jgi:hypothetical protein
MAFNLPTGGNSYNNYSQPAASPTTSGLYSLPDFNNYLNNNNPFGNKPTTPNSAPAQNNQQSYIMPGNQQQQQYPSYMAQQQPTQPTQLPQYPNYMSPQQPLQEQQQQQYPSYMASQQQQKQQYASYMEPQQPTPLLQPPMLPQDEGSAGANGLDFGMTNDPVEQARRQAQQRMDFQAANPGQSMDNALKGLTPGGLTAATMQYTPEDYKRDEALRASGLLNNFGY